MRNIKGIKGFQKMTHEEFIKKSSQNNNKLNIIGIYKCNSEKVDVECKQCGYQWQSLPSNILKNRGCPKCSKCYQCTHEEFVEKLHNVYGDEYSVLGQYVNSKTKIRLKHNTCGCEFDATPSKILSKKDPRRCSNCFGGIKYTNEEFTKKVYDLVKDEYIFLEEYKKYANQNKM